MKVTELRLAKLFSSKAKVASTTGQYPAVVAKKVEGSFCFVLLLEQLFQCHRRKFSRPKLLILRFRFFFLPNICMVGPSLEYLASSK